MDRALSRVRREVDQRNIDLQSRREQLLERADDPEAIARAARSVLNAYPDLQDDAQA